MAEISDSGDSGKGKGKARAKKSSTKIDMTPMVDLAFLLLTFFMLAATFNKAKTMEILFPKEADKPEDVQELNTKLAHTVILGEKPNEIYYYAGIFKTETGVEAEWKKVDLSKDGLRKILLDKNKNVRDDIAKINEEIKKETFKNSKVMADTLKNRVAKAKGQKEAMFVIVKTLPKTPYGRVVDIVDEINICDIGKFAIVDMNDLEKEKLQKELNK